MIQLTATQALVLKGAGHQSDRLALPFPKRLKGAAAKTVVAPLIEHGLLSEVPANPRKYNSFWGQRQDGTFTTLVITDAGLVAAGVEMEAQKSDPAVQPKPCKGTKQAMLIDLLKEPAGASLDEIMAATGWQKHTVRGAISGGLKKRLGLTIQSETVDGRGRIYKIVP